MLFSTSSLADVVSLKTEQKCGLINTFWPHLHLAEQDYIGGDYTAFFEFIGRTLQGLHPHALGFAAQELDSLLAIVYTLTLRRTCTRKEIIGYVKTSYSNTSDAAVARSIELAVRFWLGINASSKTLSVGPRNPRDSRIDWHDDQSLDQMVAAQFSHRVSRTALTNFPLDESFTAVNLKNVCRLHIRWTDNLVDHLRLNGPRGQRSLSIYRHKICLINHRKGPEPTIIQEEVLDEAIRTLDLLFPFGDPKTEMFLEEEKVQLHVVNPSELLRATDLDDFKYWRNNLAQLLNLLNGPPETVVQTLLDTRNLGQFVTLWVAIFGVFLLTILFGILATVYSVKQYRVALKSYELALALACQQKTAPLPGFCD